MHYTQLTPGDGKTRPNAWDRVKVDYTGWTTDGKMFDSTFARGRPSEFVVSAVIPGWADVIQHMTSGATWRVWIPEVLAYKGYAGKPQGMLVFELELLSIERKPAPPKTPKNVRRAPRRAKKTKGGVRYIHLSKPVRKGPRPTEESKVKAHYSGWTTDGKLFDSSVTRGKPITFRITHVIPGWTQALQVMRVGGQYPGVDPGGAGLQRQAQPPQGHFGVRHRAARHRSVNRCRRAFAQPLRAQSLPEPVSLPHRFRDHSACQLTARQTPSGSRHAVPWTSAGSPSSWVSMT